MLHKITIRELNTIGNQLPKDSSTRKEIHAQVLIAIDAKVSHILLNDEDKMHLRFLRENLTKQKELPAIKHRIYPFKSTF